MAKKEILKQKMLIVDDEEVNRAVLASIFEKEFDIIEASNGEEAIKIIEENELSVLLLDIIMEGLSGYDVLSFLKKNNYQKKFPTVVISGLDDVHSRGKLYDLGAADIITKPFIPEVVLQHVGSVLEYFNKSALANEERKSILIADDTIMNRAILAEIFNSDYQILEASDGQEAIEVIKENTNSLAAVILDVIMPRKSGFEVIEWMGDKGFLNDIPVVFITAMEKPENELRIWNLGASDVVSKPFLPHIVKKRVENVITLYNNKRKMAQMLEYQERKQDLLNSELVDVLSSLIEYRSLESGKHIMRIRIFSKILLFELVRSSKDYFMDKETILTIADATAMHDIGKIVIPDTVLNKPGKLTKEEFDIIKQHPAVGSQILSRLLGADMNEYMRYAYDICRYHHERFDGRGYPDGLVGSEIPIWAQVAGIADTYDALTTERVYKPAFDHTTAVNMILNGECGQFSPLLLNCLKNVSAEFMDAAKKYKDGLSPRSEQFVASTPIKAAKPNKSKAGQGATHKYFAMLQLLGDTVYEVNASTDEYKLVYPLVLANTVLPETGSFFKDLKLMVDEDVHIDDKERIKEGIESWQKQIEAGLSQLDSLEFRIYLSKDGIYHWYRINYKSIVGDVEGSSFALVSLHDIGGESELTQRLSKTDSRLAMLLPEKERNDDEKEYQYIPNFLERFGDCFIQYDLLNDVATYYYEGNKIVLPLLKDSDYLFNLVLDEDKKGYKDHLMRLLMGNEVEDLQFRMRASSGVLRRNEDFKRKWKRSIIIRNDSGHPIKVLSSIIDADGLLCHVDEIKIKSQIDQMTGILNKTMAEQSIASILEASDKKKDKHALVVIDIDDFKVINDTFGHLMGDGVIKAVSGKLRTMFRNTDVVGRIGGDEFLVLIKNDSDEERIKKRMQEMLFNLSEIKLKNNVGVSISVGIARYPKDGTDYSSLFNNADKALYQSKRSGKGRFSFAEENAQDFRTTLRRSRIESETRSDKGILDVFSHMLLELDGSKEAIESIFDYTARSLGLSSIMAIDKGDTVQYEWQADASFKPVCSLCGTIFKIGSAEGLEEHNGAIVCEDVNKLESHLRDYFRSEKIGAFIAAKTGDKYTKQGYIMFTVKDFTRHWSEGDIKTARLMAKLFSLLYAKSFAEVQSRESQLLIDTLFESENRACYVIDESFHILRANKICKSIAGECEDEYCYSFLAGRTVPCEGCPALKLSPNTDKASADITLKRLNKKLCVKAQTTNTDSGKKLVLMSFDSN